MCPQTFDHIVFLLNKFVIQIRCDCLYSWILYSWANKLDVLTLASTTDPEGFLAHPVNAYKLMKRLNREWPELEQLVLQDSSDGKLRPLPFSL